MSQDLSFSANRILASLPKNEYQRLEPYLNTIHLPINSVIYEASEKIESIYFPKTALISLVNTMENGATTEVSLIGGTGIIGLSYILGDENSQNRAVVQVADTTIKISARILKQEFDRGEELQRLLLRYSATKLAELAQLASCNVHHTIEERLARWLLIVSDLIQSENLPLTQEFIGTMLGVRRSGVTISAQTLQRAGIINYSRGKIKILNREALEETSCECYSLFQENFLRQAKISEE